MGGGARVLVVEDHEPSASTIALVLESAGFDTAVVHDARTARDVTLDEGVAVVLCGLSRSGTEATIDLVDGFRRRPEAALSNAGIVSLVDHDDERADLEVGADRVLVRPVGAEELSDAVTEVAARSGRRRRPVSA